MAFCAAGPVQHNVGGGNQFYLENPRVEWMLARIERRDPNTFMAWLNQIAVLESFPADVFVRLADVGNDNTYMADGNLGHRYLLHVDKPRVQVPRTRKQHLFLQTTTAVMIQKRLGILEIIVPFHNRAGNFTIVDGTAV